MLEVETVERGVMVMKDGKAWGETYADGHSTSYGWLNPADSRAKVYDPKYCKKTTDITYAGSHYTEELLKGKLVLVERTTTVRTVFKG